MELQSIQITRQRMIKLFITGSVLLAALATSNLLYVVTTYANDSTTQELLADMHLFIKFGAVFLVSFFASFLSLLMAVTVSLMQHEKE